MIGFDLKTVTHTLSTGWHVREGERPLVPAHSLLPPLPAQVPGHVHLDLMRAGVIPNPFVRLHERDVAWVDSSDWIYSTTFSVDNLSAGSMFLRFQGLDTIADIQLNGEPLGRTDNMFVPHEFDVTGRLHLGSNQLQITFQSARRVGLERFQAWNDAGNDTLPYHWDNWNERAFVRKAQYMYGWDWGPVLLSCGVWRPVELISVPCARLDDWKHDVQFGENGQAVVSLEVHIERAPGQEQTPLTVTFTLEGVGEVQVPVQGDTARAHITVDNPRLWWPHGYGEPALYDLFMTLDANEELDSRTTKIGLRTIALVREGDSDGKGEGFKFRVNGHDIFAKGANWIPEDSFPTRLVWDTDDDALPPGKDGVGERIRDAQSAGFNMLRVWGGGFYESEHFYDLCDALGLLVWQDFPYGCSYYPDTEEYAEAARVEATYAVRRLRNRASLALWCANNENQTMFEGNWTGTRPPRLLGGPLYHEVLPQVLAQEDPRTPYWPGSPFGGPQGNANSQDYGDCHNWDVWHGRGDWVHYAENNSRFCSEFGFASSCSLAAWDTVLAPEDKTPVSVAVRWHDKTRKGYETYLGYIALHYPAPQSLEDLVYFSQINQAEALKFGIEHYRRLKGRCWGTLFWQLNDCWPAQSWAIIDSLGVPKAAWYAAQKFYAPVLVSLKRDSATVEAHLTNDLLHAVTGTLTLTLETLDGIPLAREEHTVTGGPNGTSQVASFSLSPAEERERETLLHARFAPGLDGADVENILLLAEPKDLLLASPGLAVDVAEAAPGTFAVTLTAQRFAPYVWLRRADNGSLRLEDNFFHLRAGETCTLLVSDADGLTTADALRAQLVVRTL